MKRTKIIATAAALGLILTACSAVEPTSDIMSEITDETTIKAIPTGPGRISSNNEALVWFMENIESEKYEKGEKFFFNYNPVQPPQYTDCMTITAYVLCSWVDSDYKVCSVGENVLNINFSINDGFWEYIDYSVYQGNDINEILSDHSEKYRMALDEQIADYIYSAGKTTTETEQSSQSSNAQTADEAVIWFMENIESRKREDEKFFYSYRIFDERQEGDKTTLWIFCICSWINDNGEEYQGRKGVIEIDFTVKDGVWEYQEHYVDAKVNLSEQSRDKYNAVPYFEVQDTLYENIADYLKSKYTGEIIPANKIKSIYFKRGSKREYTYEFTIDFENKKYYNENTQNPKANLSDDKISKFFEDCDRFGFMVWESHTENSKDSDIWTNYELTITFDNGTEKTITLEKNRPAGWDAMYIAFFELTGTEGILG